MKQATPIRTWLAVIPAIIWLITPLILLYPGDSNMYLFRIGRTACMTMAASSLGVCLSIFVGSLSGYFQNHAKVSLLQVLWAFLIVGYGLFVMLYYDKEVWINYCEMKLLPFRTLSFLVGGMWVALWLMGHRLLKWIQPQHNPYRKTIWRIRFPLDRIVLGTIGIWESLPGIVLLIVLGKAFSVRNGGLGSTITILALISWMGLARIIRQTTLQVNSMPYIRAAHALGIPPVQIWIQHLMPNVLFVIWVPFAKIMSSLIMADVALHILGILPEDRLQTWGGLIHATMKEVLESRAGTDQEALKLCFLIILTTIVSVSLNALGERIALKHHPTTKAEYQSGTRIF